MHRMIWMAVALAAAGSAQTQVDLRTQSKSVDFSAANSTKPMSVGTVLPAACGVGQMFFLSNAPAGQNLYACVATNTWTLQSGSGGGGGSGVNVQSGGTSVGASSTLDFTGGAGISDLVSSSGSAIIVQTGINTAVVPTLASDQSDSVRYCASASGSTATYTCAMSPTLAVLTKGMVLDWTPDVTASGGPTTLNVDFLQVAPVKLPDGLTDPGPADLVAGRMQQVWYDGADFRFLNAISPAGILGEALPTCNTGVRGRLWFVAGATGVKDSLQVCAKDATNTFAWRALY
jgi:hypothetical protein